MSKTLPITIKFSSTTSEPIFGGLSVFTIMFFDGVNARTLPNFCKRAHSPLEKQVRVRSSLFKAF
jgi:hypothetical protein